LEQNKKMEENVVISAKTIVLNRKAINLSIVVFISIRVSHHSKNWINDFQKLITKHDEIIEVHRLLIKNCSSQY
jgi:Lrp/AsnC family transcriptional regulator